MTDSRDTSKGTLSIVFGVIGCFPAIPLIFPILALIFGYMAKGTAGASNGRIGRILGWIMLCIPLLAAITYIIIIVAIGGAWFWQNWFP